MAVRTEIQPSSHDRMVSSTYDLVVADVQLFKIMKFSYRCRKAGQSVAPYRSAMLRKPYSVLT
jgi:hypothetical protein